MFVTHYSVGAFTCQSQMHFACGFFLKELYDELIVHTVSVTATDFFALQQLPA